MKSPDLRSLVTDRSRVLACALVGVATLVGLLARLPGIDGAGLYFDDAWFALPARVSASTALSMVVTAPGYTMLQREWILIGPGGNTWAKVLPLVLGVVSIPVVFLLGRFLRFGRWLSVAMAGIIAFAPAAIEYSVRVKEYEGDLLMAAIVLATGEALRRRRSTRAAIACGVACVAAAILSTALMVVVAGVWVALLIDWWSDRRSTPLLFATGGITALLCTIPTLWILGRIPAQLTSFWVSQNHLVSAPYSVRHLTHLIGGMPVGLAHGLLGVPGPGVQRGTIGFASVVLLTGVGTVAVILLALRGMVRALRRRGPNDPALGAIASGLTLIFAFSLWLGGVVPLGTGRTDLVLYPSIAVVIATAAREVTAALRRTSVARVALSVCTVVASTVGIAVAWHEASWYPAQDLNSLPAAWSWQHRPDTAVIVTLRNTYTWAFDGISAFTVHVSRDNPASTTIGYWVTFDNPRVVAQTDTAVTDRRGIVTDVPTARGLWSLPHSIRRLWLFVSTASTLSPSTVHLTGAAADRIVPSQLMRSLTNRGWQRTSVVEHAPGVAAILYTR